MVEMEVVMLVVVRMLGVVIAGCVLGVVVAGLLFGGNERDWVLAGLMLGSVGAVVGAVTGAAAEIVMALGRRKG